MAEDQTQLAEGSHTHMCKCVDTQCYMLLAQYSQCYYYIHVICNDSSISFVVGTATTTTPVGFKSMSLHITIFCLDQTHKMVQVVRELRHQLFHMTLLEPLGGFDRENVFQMVSNNGTPPRSACPDEQSESTYQQCGSQRRIELPALMQSSWVHTAGGAEQCWHVCSCRGRFWRRVHWHRC